MSGPTEVGDDPWARPLWSPGGGDAFVYFVVFGAEGDLLEISASEHRVVGVPDGIDARQLDEAWAQSYFDPPLGDQIRLSDPETAEVAEACDGCIVVTGTVADPPTFGYLRDSIGITTAALDAGGVAVLNLQTFDLYSPERWREQIFDGPDVQHRLVTILVSDEEDDDAEPAPGNRVWLHTRGLRVFGRPDLSVRSVAADDVDLVVRMLNALIGQLARGLVIDDGATMEVGGDLGTLHFTRQGHLDDPDFNNEHLEIVRGWRGSDPEHGVALECDRPIQIERGERRPTDPSTRRGRR